MSETEVKYLLSENSKDFTTENFSEHLFSLDNLINEAAEYGAEIDQGYLDLKYSKEILKNLGIKLEFNPYELRVRRITQKGENKYFITFKSDGTITREEKEEPISQCDYDNYFALTEGKRIAKTRLTKNINGLDYEFDIYNDRQLIVCEIELEDESLLEKVLAMGINITSDKNYKNKNLAK